MAKDLSVDYDRVQILVSGYIAMTALVQLIIGPLSDRYGRRPVMLGALAILLLASLVCMTAHSIELLTAARMAQTAVVAGLVLSRAIIRDMVPVRRGGIDDRLCDHGHDPCSHGRPNGWRPSERRLRLACKFCGHRRRWTSGAASRAPRPRRDQPPEKQQLYRPVPRLAGPAGLGTLLGFYARRDLHSVPSLPFSAVHPLSGVRSWA